MLVGHRQHNGADCEAVEIVVNENQAAKRDRCKLRARTGLDFVRSPLAERSRTARLVHQADHNAQDHKENQDAYIPAIPQLCGHHFKNSGNAVFQAESVWCDVLQHTAYYNANEQRRVNLFCNKSQADGNDWRQQGPECPVQVASSLFAFRERDCAGNHRQKECDGDDQPFFGCSMVSPHK